MNCKGFAYQLFGLWPSSPPSKLLPLQVRHRLGSITLETREGIKNFLLCFFTFLSVQFSFGQIKFCKILPSSEYYWEYAHRLIEANNHYFIPIHSSNSFGPQHEFYILKMDKSGKIVKRYDYGNWDYDRGQLYNTLSDKIWKISTNGDTIEHYFYIEVKLLDADLKELKKIRVPRTYPKNGGGALIHDYNLTLKNGDFINMIRISSPPKTDLTNYIRLSKEGELLSNITYPAF